MSYTFSKLLIHSGLNCRYLRLFLGKINFILFYFIFAEIASFSSPFLFFSQELASRILTYFIPGPRIASTPEDSLLHPNQMFFKKLVISEGGVPVLIKLLEHPAVEVRHQVSHLLFSILYLFGTFTRRHAADYVIIAFKGSISTGMAGST